MGIKRKLTLVCFAALFALAFLFISMPEAKAQDLLSSIIKEDIGATASKLEFEGNNMIGNGDVRLRYKDIYITCDKIIVNMTTKDLEAVGKVKLLRRVTSRSEVEADELKRLQDDPKVKVIVDGYVSKPSGRQRILVKTITEKLDWEGEKATGNLSSGVFDLGKYEGTIDQYYFKADSAERQADGSITIYNAEMTSCEYIVDNHEHYSITASKIRLIPREDIVDLSDKGSREVGSRYDIWAYWCWVNIGGVPVLPLPVIHKPRNDRGWGGHVRVGSDTDWGYFVQTKKTWTVWEDPLIETSVYLDYYGRRGPGGGVDMTVTTEKSKTYGYAYGLYDRQPEKEAATGQRFDIDKGRYDLKLNNLTHVTPRMDFRGQIEKLSDINFLYDFFRERYDQDPQPPTFASLDYQFDRFTASVNYRQRINSFFTEVERLPEGRIDIPRQELFSNIQYQGQTTLGYFNMKWRDYDEARTMGNGVDPKDYKSLRFDTLHMFYYPLQFDWLNVLPRAGFRLTYYSKTSKTKIDPDDLNTMFTVDNDQGAQVGGDVVNYDNKGGAKLRFIGETGLEMNTKIYRTWNDVKSAFWDIDGIRHVMVPYFNYNFIPKPTLDRDKIYYFDDIDRIDEQNFIRLGLSNRLQTRRGDYNKEEIYTWASLENYFDFHFNREEDLNGKKFTTIGDFGTKATIDLFPNFHINTDLLINAGKFNINKFLLGFTYDITDEWKVGINYNYQRNFDQRSTYSMGSSLTDIMSGSAFLQRYSKFQDVDFKLFFPICDKTRGEIQFSYDIDNKMVRDSIFRLIRTFHCWELALEYGFRQNNDDKDEKENKQTFGLMFYLTAAPQAKITARQSTGGSGGDSDN